MPKLSFNDVYKEWRNRARRFDPRSVVFGCLNILNEPAPDQLAELKRAPWLLMLMVKWVCQDRYLDQQPLPSISRAELDELHQRLWELPERLDIQPRDSLPLRLFMRQILRPQLGFQRGITKGFVREAALLALQPVNHPIRQRFLQKTGLQVEDFIDLSLATYAAIVKGQRSLCKHWFSALAPAFSQEVINTYRSCMSRSYSELKEFCRSLPDASRKVASEYFEFPVLRRYPFFRVADNLVCWHPAVFYRGSEDFVHSVLSEEGQEYIDRFSRLFERHVLEQAQRVPARFYGEAELRSFVRPETKVPDGLLAFGTCNVYVESKAGLFGESAMTIGHSEMFARKTRAVTTAVTQAWETSAALRAQRRAPEDVTRTDTDYLLIVTNKDLGASPGEALAKMYPPGTLSCPTPGAERFLPVSRIYLLSIEEFERLVAAATAGKIDVPNFLAKCVERDRSPTTSRLLFEQHLNDEGVPLGFSDMVSKAIEDSVARLTEALAAEPKQSATS